MFDNNKPPFSMSGAGTSKKFEAKLNPMKEGSYIDGLQIFKMTATIPWRFFSFKNFAQ
jgi:hypothetical protein